MESGELAAERQAFISHLLAEKKSLERCLAAVDAALMIYTAGNVALAPPPRRGNPVSPPLVNAPAPAVAPPAETTSEGKTIVGKTFTPARNRVIADEWPKGTPVAEIYQKLRAVPGLPVTIEMIGHQAGKMGLKRPDDDKPVAPAPPANRMDTIRRVAASLGAGREPVGMDFEQIRRWASERGINFRTWDDLPAVNERLEHLGQPPFKRDFTRRSGA